MNFAEFPFRDGPKRVGRACSVALRSTETVVFDPFWPPYASQIHAQSIARTPFRRCPQCSPTDRREGLFRPISAFLRRPNQPSERCSDPFSDSLSTHSSE